jgi:hypothetical protein
MRDRDEFPNPYDIGRDDVPRDRDEVRRRRMAGPDDYEQPRPYEDEESDLRGEEEPRRRRFGRYYGRFGRFGAGSPYSGHSGFGGSGWTAGGDGDAGYNTSGFGATEYGRSRVGGGAYADGMARDLGPVYAGRRAEGPHRGKGPRGYKRSDESILDEVVARLTADSRVDASEIDVEVNEGHVTLRGTVDEKQMKWLAEDLADSVRGVTEVDNGIRTRRT